MANRSTKKSPKKRKTKTVKAKKSAELKGGEILRDEILVITLFVFSILLMLSNFGLGGRAGGFLKEIQLGSFGTVGYLFPIVILLIGIILVSNKGSLKSSLKSLAILLVMISTSSIVYIFMSNSPLSLEVLREAYNSQSGGGLLGGLLGGSLKAVISTIGAFIVLCMIIIIALVYISERSFVSFVKLNGKKAYNSTKEDLKKRREKQKSKKALKEQERKKLKQQKEQEEEYPYPEEEQEFEEAVRPRRKIDFATTTLDIVNHAQKQLEPAYENVSGSSYRTQDGYYPQDEYDMQGGYYPQDEYNMQNEYYPDEYGMQDGYYPNEYDMQGGYLPQDDYSLPNEFAAQEEFAEPENVTKISKRSRSRKKDRVSIARPLRNSKKDTVKRGITKVQNLSDIIKKKPEDIDEDTLNKLNNILQDDSVESRMEDFGEELELTADTMMNEGLVREDDYEQRLRPAASGSNDVETAKTGFNDEDEDEEFLDYDEEKPLKQIYKKETDKDNLIKAATQNNIATASGKIIEKAHSESLDRLRANEYKKPQERHERQQRFVPVREHTQNAVKEYVYPPTTLLNLPPRPSNRSDEEFKATALKLQETLHNFGIEVQLGNISRGPTVTRYEILPEPGVKVSKIVGLTDDIKLNLAASDIRIEAPIPGKSAVGIEVPNKENTIVSLRELFESEEFRNSKAKLNFALGKDIAGKPIVSDIATMPHLLIAGATGAGKSVCINTLIMSVLYKYTPQEVRLIMVDPKVVELSVYNGIPHLLIPVVTDPKKAAAALNWAVKEMTDRYNKFAKEGVRNLKGYNDKLSGIDPEFEKLPQILIIIDELADLMMVAQNEVEDAICRLAQLARACGIHLVIATQRPSVNVITGLIKANIPSRIAFAVSSGIDSRTILDTVGAEKLLGKGDMLFSPQSLPKPIRVQGAFVSDTEVQNVVDFLVNQELDISYDESAINNMEEGGADNLQGAVNEVDELFAQVGRFIIDSQKASIGNLQRVFRIGFNRAARIMDQLFEAGVVGKEQGTKPRQVLMNSEEFEDYISTAGIAR